MLSLLGTRATVDKVPPEGTSEVLRQAAKGRLIQSLGVDLDRRHRAGETDTGPHDDSINPSAK